MSDVSMASVAGDVRKLLGGANFFSVYFTVGVVVVVGGRHIA